MQVPYLFMRLTKIVATSNHRNLQKEQQDKNGSGEQSRDLNDSLNKDLDDDVLLYVNELLSIHKPSVVLIKHEGFYYYKDVKTDAILGDFDLKSFEISLKRSNQKNSDFLEDITYGDQPSPGTFLNLDI